MWLLATTGHPSLVTIWIDSSWHPTPNYTRPLTTSKNCAKVSYPTLVSPTQSLVLSIFTAIAARNLSLCTDPTSHCITKDISSRRSFRNFSTTKPRCLGSTLVNFVSRRARLRLQESSSFENSASWTVLLLRHLSMVLLTRTGRLRSSRQNHWRKLVKFSVKL